MPSRCRGTANGHRRIYDLAARIKASCVVLLIFGSVVWHRSAQAKATTGPSTSAITRVGALIDQLDDPDADTRRAATLQMNSLNGNALPIVEDALKRDDLSPEAHARLELALKFLRPRARKQEAARRRIEWETRQFHEAFEHGGGADAKFDRQAHAAIDSYLRLGPDPLHGPAEPRDAALAAFKSVKDAGCRDPLIDTLYCLAAGDGRMDGSDLADGGIERAKTQMVQGNYPAVVKLRVVLNSLESSPYASPEFCRYPVMLLAEVAKSPDLPPGIIDALAARFYDIQYHHKGFWDNWEPFLATYRSIAPHSQGPLILEARESAGRAWDDWQVHASNGTVTPQIEQEFDASIARAVSLLESAFKLEPSDSGAATVMLTVKMLSNRGGRVDRAEIQPWFERATRDDPDNFDAFDRMARCLSPDWGGSSQAMLEFGHECLKTQNWRGGTPVILVRIHESLANLSPDRKEYFQQPDVWDDIAGVYAGLLLNFPDSRVRRCEYAKYAMACGKWSEAKKQFDVIADNPDLNVFGSRASYDYLRRKANRNALSPPATAP